MVKISIFLNTYILILKTLLADNNAIVPMATLFDSQSNYTHYGNCFLFDGMEWAYYDLTKLSITHNKTYDYNITETEEGFTLFYDFCQTTLTKCNDKKSLINAKYSDGTCKTFTGPEPLKKWNYNIDELKFTLAMQTDENCVDNLNYTTYFVFKCDPEGSEGEFVFDQHDNGNLIEFSNIPLKNTWKPCFRKLAFISKNACPRFDIYPLWLFYVNNNFFFGMFFILSGFFTLFFGFRKQNLTRYLYSYHLVMYLFYCSLIFVDFPQSMIFMYWFVHILAMMLGFFLSYIIAESPIYIKAIFGGYVGISLQSFLFFLVFARIKELPGFVFLCSLVAFLLFFASVFAFGLKKYTGIIVSSSFAGSFLIIRGIAMYAGGLPYEGYIIDLINKKEYDSVTRNIEKVTVYWYIGTCCFLTLLGIFFQFKQKSMDDLVKGGLKNLLIIEKKASLINNNNSSDTA